MRLCGATRAEWVAAQDTPKKESLRGSLRLYKKPKPLRFHRTSGGVWRIGSCEPNPDFRFLAVGKRMLRTGLRRKRNGEGEEG